MLLFVRDIMPAVKKNKDRESSADKYDPSLWTRYSAFHMETDVCILCRVKETKVAHLL